MRKGHEGFLFVESQL